MRPRIYDQPIRLPPGQERLADFAQTIQRWLIKPLEDLLDEHSTDLTGVEFTSRGAEVTADAALSVATDAAAAALAAQNTADLALRRIKELTFLTY